MNSCVVQTRWREIAPRTFESAFWCPRFPVVVRQTHQIWRSMTQNNIIFKGPNVNQTDGDIAVLVYPTLTRRCSIHVYGQVQSVNPPLALADKSRD